MNAVTMKNTLCALLIVGAGASLTGCLDLSTATPVASVAPPSSVVKEAAAFRPDAKAGVRVDAPDPSKAASLWATTLTRSFNSRPDPFALQSKERSYENSQLSERIFGESGGWSLRFQPEPETITVPEAEPQPPRRLAGVIVGDSVLALIDMGDGQLKLIAPGQDVDGWHVVSIDAEKAILTRSGNKLPKQITVRLQEPLSNGGSGMGGGPGDGPGSGGPGMPGTPPGGPGDGDL